MRIDHPMQESVDVYTTQMKPLIEKADQLQEVIQLRRLLREKEAALRVSRRQQKSQRK